jgi:GrpB-like predicted nucleotidyltransferase (UPF0157 family)
MYKNMKAVGLKRGTVMVVKHDPSWADEFRKERSRIIKTCGLAVVSVEHVGSTSVPGLAAKPIIDIAVGVKRLKDAKMLIKPLRKIGFNFYRISRYEIFLAKGPDTLRTHYIHVVRYKGAKWKIDIGIRNYLRKHPKEVAKYAKLKRELANMYANDRYTYTAKKDAFIKSLIARVKAWETHNKH